MYAGYHLAQVNIAQLRAPIDSPQLAHFVAQLAPINALADAAPGFVWRLQTEDGDATAVRAFGDDRIIVNMSVWESLDSLAAFVYRSAHVEVMRSRRQWFEKLFDPFVALWWVPAGAIPTVAQAEDHVAQLRRDGPTPQAFTFRVTFPPSEGIEVARLDDRWNCPAG